MKLGPILVGVAVLGGATAAFWYFASKAGAATGAGFVPTPETQAACWLKGQLPEIKRAEPLTLIASALGAGSTADLIWRQLEDRLNNVCTGASTASSYELKVLTPLAKNQNLTAAISAVKALAQSGLSGVGYMGWQYK